MGKIENVLKDEVARLSRRETRKMLAKTVEDVRQLRKRLIALEREVKAMKKAKAGERAKAKVRKATDTVAGEPGSDVRLSPGLIRKLRRRLNISQRELAELVGVSTVTVGLWETGRTRPRAESKARIVALRSLGRRDVQRLLAE